MPDNTRDIDLSSDGDGELSCALVRGPRRPNEQKMDKVLVLMQRNKITMLRPIEYFFTSDKTCAKVGSSTNSAAWLVYYSSCWSTQSTL